MKSTVLRHFLVNLLAVHFYIRIFQQWGAKFIPFCWTVWMCEISCPLLSQRYQKFQTTRGRYVTSYLGSNIFLAY